MQKSDKQGKPKRPKPQNAKPPNPHPPPQKKKKTEKKKNERTKNWAKALLGHGLPEESRRKGGLLDCYDGFKGLGV